MSKNNLALIELFIYFEIARPRMKTTRRGTPQPEHVYGGSGERGVGVAAVIADRVLGDGPLTSDPAGTQTPGKQHNKYILPKHKRMKKINCFL